MAAGLPSAILVEYEGPAHTWVDISSLVVGESIEINVGGDSAASGLQPGTLDFDLDNADGRFTPDNPTSTHWQKFVEGKRIRVRVTKSATTYNRFMGRIVEITPDYPTEPTQSQVHVFATDLLGDLERITLMSPLKSAAATGYLGADIAFYPLDDTNARRGAADLTNRCANLTVTNLLTAGTANFSATSGLDGDGSSFVALTNGRRLHHARPAFVWDHTSASPENATGFFYFDASETGELFALAPARRSSSDTYLTVGIDADGIYCDSYVDGVFDSTTGSSPIDSGWHCIGLSSLSGDVTLSVDSVDIATIGVAATTPFRCLSLGGYRNVSVAYFGLGAACTTTFMMQVGLGGTDAAPLTMSTTESVIEGILGLSDLEGTITVTGSGDGPAWDATMLATADMSGLELLLTYARSLNGDGIAYHAYSASGLQTISVPLRDVTRPAAVALTVDAESDLNGGPTLERGLGAVVAVAKVATPEALVTATSTTAAASVGASEREVNVILGDRAQLEALASDALAQGASLRTRLTSVGIDLATAGNDLYAAFFALTIGERLRLSGLPSTYFGVTYIDGYVQGWTERPGVEGYEVVLNLAPADAPTEAIWDTSRWAFGDGVCTVTGGTAVGTTSTGTMTLTWATADPLTTAAGDYPMDFDWNGERVTVTAAPAGGTSPRTLTITARGVAPTVARVHSAGEAIEPWDAARWAL